MSAENSTEDFDVELDAADIGDDPAVAPPLAAPPVPIRPPLPWLPPAEEEPPVPGLPPLPVVPPDWLPPEPTTPPDELWPPEPEPPVPTAGLELLQPEIARAQPVRNAAAPIVVFTANLLGDAWNSSTPRIAVSTSRTWWVPKK